MGVKYPVIDMKGTGRNIRRIMLEKGQTVKEVQDYLGLGTPQGIYHWFAGRNLPSLDNLYALARFFGVTVDDMLVGTIKEGIHTVEGNSVFSIPKCVDGFCETGKCCNSMISSERLYLYYRRLMRIKVG